MDKDLLSIQQVRDLLKAAKTAQAIYAEFTQEQVDNIFLAASIAANQQRILKNLLKWLMKKLVVENGRIK